MCVYVSNSCWVDLATPGETRARSQTHTADTDSGEPQESRNTQSKCDPVDQTNFPLVKQSAAVKGVWVCVYRTVWLGMGKGEGVLIMYWRNNAADWQLNLPHTRTHTPNPERKCFVCIHRGLWRPHRPSCSLGLIPLHQTAGMKSLSRPMDTDMANEISRNLSYGAAVSRYERNNVRVCGQGRVSGVEAAETTKDANL